MRLSHDQIDAIRQIGHQIAGAEARLRVFGSRLNDNARGGDLDVMVEMDTPVPEPALLAARLSARLSRAMQGRNVDVVISAPNLLRLPIHDIAFKEGVLL
jgi:predicted nucleotidyltransferase